MLALLLEGSWCCSEEVEEEEEEEEGRVVSGLVIV